MHPTNGFGLSGGGGALFWASWQPAFAPATMNGKVTTSTKAILMTIDIRPDLVGPVVDHVYRTRRHALRRFQKRRGNIGMVNFQDDRFLRRLNCLRHQDTVADRVHRNYPGNQEEALKPSRILIYV